MKKLKLAFAGACSALIGLTAPMTAHAEYPDKPVTIVVPYGPGGAADLAARTLTTVLTDSLGAPLLVVNRAGAAGVTGSVGVAKGKADGYTLLLSRVGSQATVPAINKRIPYTWDEFTFLGLLEINPFVLTVSAKSPYKTLEDLATALRNGEKVSYASAGVGGLLHLGVVVLLERLGIDQAAMQHVPFKGGGEAGAAIVGGHVDVFFQNASGVIGSIQSGHLRALAVTSKERAPELPDVPTFAELGYPKMNVVVGWSGLWGPPNLPPEVVTKWTSTLEGLKTNEQWLKLTKDLGSEPAIMTPEDTKAFVKEQYEEFKAVAERVGLAVN